MGILLLTSRTQVINCLKKVHLHQDKDLGNGGSICGSSLSASRGASNKTSKHGHALT